EDHSQNPFESSDDQILGSTIPGEIVMHTMDEAGKRPSETSTLVTAIHEYYHAVQFDWAGIGWAEFELYDADTSDIRPEWMVEGSAEYMAYKVLADNNLYAYDRARTRKVASAERFGISLSNLEKHSGSTAPYSVGFMATEYLINNYGGTAAMMRYWKGL